ncbi:YjcZ family sporulation protein [Lederbergia sp. NSJ-179]|uniref:YjcZ family sporulation protein n=1 Tax=Lederbergia sp. NSJ-179 TaxID=2931402 RepID=UPI001FD31665|nr:YjcZ family sporulation protein [Lederbergia sp. NSJ-179]MCJ7841146.1 YjcZ family sporulation protein [Lederbergia sp. NSJ-179]
MYSGGYDGCYDGCYPAYGYGDYCYPVRNGFALIVVLFILLIIIGACWAFPK